MDTETARELIALNNRFYTEHAASFSATRNAPWNGWQRLADELRERGWANGAERRRTVLDVACGNLRFERFLADALPDAPFAFHAVDACTPLAGETEPGNGTVARVQFQQIDVLAALLDGTEALNGTAILDLPEAHDLTVSFGFLHHVPGASLRQRLLDALIDATAPGGFICLSFWQFMDDERLARKAARADKLAAVAPPWPGYAPEALDEHDHFLGWQSDPAPLRYCHHFPEQEVDALVASAAPRARELARWSADGASGALNRYLLLQRSEE